MDVSGGDGCMTRCDRNLMQVRHHIPGGVKPLYASTLMAVDLEAPPVRRGSAQCASETGTDIASHCRINNIEIQVTGS
jgi:hypothetical protein